MFYILSVIPSLCDSVFISHLRHISGGTSHTSGAQELRVANGPHWTDNTGLDSERHEYQWEEPEGLSDVHFGKMVLTTMWRTHVQAGMNEGREARDKVFCTWLVRLEMGQSLWKAIWQYYQNYNCIDFMILQFGVGGSLSHF